MRATHKQINGKIAERKTRKGKAENLFISRKSREAWQGSKDVFNLKPKYTPFDRENIENSLSGFMLLCII